MITALLLATIISAQSASAQQPIPAAPEPKTTPTPLKFPMPKQSVPAPTPPEKSGDEAVYMGVSKEILNSPQGYLIKDFLTHRLRPTITQHWSDVMPEEAKSHRTFGIGKKGKSGKVMVAFTLHKKGEITDIVLEEASGDKLLDAAALKAVKDSQPLPLPAAFSKDQLKVRATFLYNVAH
jgi:TonB family protein